MPEEDVSNFDTTKEERLDVIQIVLKDSSLMFDLHEEKEIAILNKYHGLFGYDKFVQTGFQIVGKDATGPPITTNHKQNCLL